MCRFPIFSTDFAVVISRFWIRPKNPHVTKYLWYAVSHFYASFWNWIGIIQWIHGFRVVIILPFLYNIIYFRLYIMSSYFVTVHCIVGGGQNANTIFFSRAVEIIRSDGERSREEEENSYENAFVSFCVSSSNTLWCEVCTSSHSASCCDVSCCWIWVHFFLTVFFPLDTIKKSHYISTKVLISNDTG